MQSTRRGQKRSFKTCSEDHNESSPTPTGDQYDQLRIRFGCPLVGPHVLLKNVDDEVEKWKRPQVTATNLNSEINGASERVLNGVDVGGRSFCKRNKCTQTDELQLDFINGSIFLNFNMLSNGNRLVVNVSNNYGAEMTFEDTSNVRSDNT